MKTMIFASIFAYNLPNLKLKILHLHIHTTVFCGLCKEIITFATLYQKNYSYERDKSPKDNPCLRL